MSWELTPLKSGALPSDNYHMDITGLSASTTYAYRAYVIIDGIVYYGQTLTGTTGIVPTYPPSGVTTGSAEDLGTTNFNVSGSSVGWKGTLDIEEYGILYTQNSFWGTNNNLVYENTANFSKLSTLANIGESVLFNNAITGLVSGTLTYFRAFAKNASGVGYGNIETATPILEVVELFFDSIIGGDTVTMDANNLVSQTLTIVLDYHIEASVDNNYNEPGYHPNQATTRLEISLNGGSSWTTISEVTAECSDPQDFDFQVANGTYTIPIGITVSNIGLIRIRGSYDCNDDSDVRFGLVRVIISNSTTIDTGLRLILAAANTFGLDCNTPPQIS